MSALESNAFEQDSWDFVDRGEYDEAQNALFNIVRKSFKAGWQAAGGNPTEPQPVFRLVPKEPEE